MTPTAPWCSSTRTRRVPLEGSQTVVWREQPVRCHGPSRLARDHRGATTAVCSGFGAPASSCAGSPPHPAAGALVPRNNGEKSNGRETARVMDIEPRMFDVTRSSPRHAGRGAGAIPPARTFACAQLVFAASRAPGRRRGTNCRNGATNQAQPPFGAVPRRASTSPKHASPAARRTSILNLTGGAFESSAPRTGRHRQEGLRARLARAPGRPKNCSARRVYSPARSPMREPPYPSCSPGECAHEGVAFSTTQRPPQARDDSPTITADRAEPGPC